MNEKETAMVLELVRNHYWRTLRDGENNQALMLGTWSKALADVPLTPYIENALDWWFKHESWPPQAAQLRERAKMAMRNDRAAQESAALKERYAPLPERKMAPLHIRRHALARLRAGDINADDLDREIERLVADSAGADSGERRDDGGRVRDRARLECW